MRSVGSRVVTVNDVLDGHSVLDLSCLDRLYLSGFVQRLQTSGRVVYFLHDHRGMPIASPAVFEQIGARFQDGMQRFADANHIPVVRFRRGVRKVEVMRPHLDRAARTGRSQVAAIGVAQEFAVVWTARKRDTDPSKSPQFSSPRSSGESPSSTCMCGTRTSVRRSSRSAPTSPTRSRYGSTGMNGQSAKPPRPELPSLSCLTGSPPAMIPPPCKRSATVWAPVRSGCSSNAGPHGCRCH